MSHETDETAKTAVNSHVLIKRSKAEDVKQAGTVKVTSVTSVLFDLRSSQTDGLVYTPKLT